MTASMLWCAVLTVTGLAATFVVPLTPAHATDDVPVGAPAADHRPEPTLATPAGWPFAQRLSPWKSVSNWRND